MSFIDRYDELAIVRVLLDSLSSQNPIQFPLREYVGIGGIGKTALLKAICIECEERHLPSVFVDYRDLVSLSPTASVCRVLERVVLGLLTPNSPSSEATVKSMVKDTVSSAETCTEIPAFENALREQNLLSKVLPLFKEVCGVLMLDSLNLVPQDALAFLGKEVIFPLSEGGNILILLAGRSRVDWGKLKYRLWRRTKSTALLTFPLEHTVEQVDYFGDIGDQIQRITCGHPEANDIIVRILSHVEEQEKLGEFRFGDYEARLVAAIVDGVIRERRIIPKELFRAFCILSVFRYVNIDMPAEVLVGIDGAANWSDPFQLFVLIGRMQQETDFVIKADPGELGYTIDEFVRRSLSLFLRFFNPDDFLNITRVAVRYYERKFHETPTRVEFLIEKAYHCIDELRMSQQSTDLEIAHQVCRELKEDLEPTMAGPFYLVTSGSGISTPGIPQALDRQLAFERLRNRIRADAELRDRIGDTYATDFLCNTLDDLWERFRSVGVGVLEMLKHYRSPDASEEEPDYYDVSFRIAGEPAGITRRIEISPQVRNGIRNDIRMARSKTELLQLGLGLLAQFPSGLQRMLREHTEPMIIDVNDASIPWELLHDGREFLALRIPLGKQIRTPEVPRLNEDLTDDIRVLLVGVPASPKHSLPPLRYVEEEINNLMAFFREEGRESGIAFDPANDILFDYEADVWTVQKRLSSGEYKIIHFAGHSIGDPQSDPEGILLHDGILRAENIKDALRGRPLVVLNTCQSARGQTELVETGYRGYSMSGLASAFVVGGALACVASIWEVQDDSGVQLIIDFYRGLMKGAMTGEALRRAKYAEYRRERTDARTWASYILFGNPSRSIANRSQEISSI